MPRPVRSLFGEHPLLSPLLVRITSRWSQSLQSSPLALLSLAPLPHPFTSPSSVVVHYRLESPSTPQGPTSPNVSATSVSCRGTVSYCYTFAVTVAVPSNSPAYNRDYFNHWITSKLCCVRRTSSEQVRLKRLVILLSQRFM